MPNLRLVARRAAVRNGIDPNLFLRQIQQESGFQVAPSGRDANGQILPNSSGALGVAQIVPKWHPNVDARDPVASLNYAAHLMAGLTAKYGSYERALSAYNSGRPDAYKDPNFAKGQTYNYVRRIMGGTTPTAPRESPSLIPTPASPTFPKAGASSGLSSLLRQSMAQGDRMLGLQPLSFPTSPVMAPSAPVKPLAATSALAPTLPTSPTRLPFGKPGSYSFVNPAGHDIAHVDPRLLQAVDALGRALGKRITVESGYRDYKKQAQLYKRYIDSGRDIRYIAAAPGTSNHNKGLAVDLTIDGVPISSAVPAAVLAKYGLHNPVRGDLPHTTLLGVNG